MKRYPDAHVTNPFYRPTDYPSPNLFVGAMRAQYEELNKRRAAEYEAALVRLSRDIGLTH